MQASPTSIASYPLKSRKESHGLPPVIVLNLFHTGLGIVRQLHGSGVRVVGLSANSRVYGNFSRLCEVRSAPDSRERPEQLAEFLLGVGPELDGAVIFPTRDADILFLDRYRSVLQRFYRLAIPASGVLSQVMDKSAVAETAVRSRIPIPRTIAVRQSSQLNSAAEIVGFPCVVKPVRSAYWRERDHWTIVGHRKAFRVSDFRELNLEYEQVSQVHREVLLQEWIPGEMNQLVIWAGYVRERRPPLAYFTARKLLQCPEEFGTGCVVQSDAVPDLLGPSVELCRALNYRGIAEIEYKWDARDRQFKLIEINPRHWDWHELGRASQVNLTWAAYCDMTGKRVQPSIPTVGRAKWVAEDALLMHVLSGIYRRKPGLLKHWKDLLGQRVYGVFSWKDPMPFVGYSLTCMVPKLIHAVIKNIRGHALGQSTTKPLKA